jgi:hypothetical protein
MIGLLELSAPAGQAVGVERIEVLPAPPAARYSGIMIRCDDAAPLATALEWFARVRAERPAFALGIVARPEMCFRRLGACRHPVRPVLAPHEVVGGELPVSALSEMFEASIEGRLLEELVRDHGGGILAEQNTLECLISHAVRGGTVQRAAKDVGWSIATIGRRLARFGLRPGRLRSWVRVQAYEFRIEQGETPASALAAGGWHCREDYVRVRNRVM